MMVDEWDNYSEQERVAAQIYNTRAQSPFEMTVERWERIKSKFPGSYKICMEDALDEMEDW